jgi:hypothetical protein
MARRTRGSALLGPEPISSRRGGSSGPRPTANGSGSDVIGAPSVARRGGQDEDEEEEEEEEKKKKKKV